MTFSRLIVFLYVILLCITGAAKLFQGDGSDEPGFVPPPARKEMPPPPANMSGGETLIPYPPPPAAPMSRTEKKNPPRPPIKIIKLKSEYGEEDWNARPNDVNNLLKELKKQCDVDWDWEARYLSEVYISPLPGEERTTKGKTDANKTK